MSGTVKLKYLFYLSLSLLSGFFTFRVFIPLVNSGNFNKMFILLNSLILMIILFFSYSGDDEFVQRNFWILLFLPMTLLFINNIVIGWLIGELNERFIYFMSSSALLILFSHRASLYKLEMGPDREKPEI